MRGIVENYDAGMNPSRRSGGISLEDIFIFSSRDLPAGGGSSLGTMTYVAPKSGRYKLMVQGCGGGAFYDVGSGTYAGGGGGGYSETQVNLVKGDVVTAVLARAASSTISARGITLTAGAGADGGIGASVGGVGGTGSGGSINLTGGTGGSGANTAGTAGGGLYGGQGGSAASGVAAGGGAASNSNILPGGRGGSNTTNGQTPMNGAGAGSGAGNTFIYGGLPTAAVVFLGA